MDVKDMPGCSKEIQEESEDCEMEEDDEDVLFIKMDIKESLNSLRLYLEETFKLSLKGCKFTLQQSNVLCGENTLSDLCDGGQGDVQVNVRVADAPEPSIDILDILKLDDSPLSQDELTDGDEYDEPEGEEDQTLWIPSKEYNERMLKLKIPSDPKEWETSDVRHWLLWAVRHFSLPSVRLVDWMLTGAHLCSMALPEFRKRVPSDPGNLFWKHCQILRKHKVVAEMSKERGVTFSQFMRSKEVPTPIQIKAEGNDEQVHSEVAHSRESKEVNRLSVSKVAEVEEGPGEMPLWRFLLELLTDPEWTAVIRWEGTDGTFSLDQPETVAKLWGYRRNNPTMTYGKFSRTLRHYYKGDIINAVPGVKYKYRFVCDLKLLVGYSAAELKKLVKEAPRKSCEEDSNSADDEDRSLLPLPPKLVTRG